MARVARSFTTANPGNMSEWQDQDEDEPHDEEKVGSKRPRGTRGPEGKLAQKARTLRRRAERAEGHLNAAKAKYRLGTMTEQSFELVLCHPTPKRDLYNAWQTFCGWITRRALERYAMARVEPAQKGKDQTQSHLYLVRHELRVAPGVRLTKSFTHNATAVQRVTVNGKAHKRCFRACEGRPGTGGLRLIRGWQGDGYHCCTDLPWHSRVQVRNE